MAITFTIATPADIALVLQFMREYYEFDHLTFEEEVARSALERMIGDEALGRIWLISYAEESVGYLVLTLGYSLEFGGRDAFIDEVYIRSSHRGKGIGTAALTFAEDQCRGLGVRALHLEVEHANTNAYGVYRKAGFVDHERHMMTKIITP
jgi:ribosomal protein S18 acetylase RimI-like enzyme